jgi:hypothetical protein
MQLQAACDKRQSRIVQMASTSGVCVGCTSVNVWRCVGLLQSLFGHIIATCSVTCVGQAPELCRKRLKQNSVVCTTVSVLALHCVGMCVRTFALRGAIHCMLCSLRLPRT